MESCLGHDSTRPVSWENTSKFEHCWWHHHHLGHTVIAHHCSFNLWVFISISKDLRSQSLWFYLEKCYNIPGARTGKTSTGSSSHSSWERTQSVLRHPWVMCLLIALQTSGKLLLVPVLILSVIITFCLHWLHLVTNSSTTNRKIWKWFM